jgi:hypothetical protein
MNSGMQQRIHGLGNTTQTKRRHVKNAARPSDYSLPSDMVVLIRVILPTIESSASLAILNTTVSSINRLGIRAINLRPNYANIAPLHLFPQNRVEGSVAIRVHRNGRLQTG